VAARPAAMQPTVASHKAQASAFLIRGCILPSRPRHGRGWHG
jgi:hypothetical protein